MQAVNVTVFSRALKASSNAKGGHGPIVEGHPNTFLPPHAVSGVKTAQTSSFLGFRPKLKPNRPNFFRLVSGGFRGGGSQRSSKFSGKFKGGSQVVPQGPRKVPGSHSHIYGFRYVRC